MSQRIKVYIAPYSTMTKTFQQKYLDKHVEFLGFIDSSKEGQNIYKVDDIHTSEYDYIYIISPNHRFAINKSFIKSKIKQSKINHIVYEDETFKTKSFFRIYLKNQIKVVFLNIQHKLHVKYKKLFEKTSYFMLLSPDFVDINLKELYVYLQETNYKCCIATNNKEHYKLLKKENFCVVLYPSFLFLYYSLKSKYKILDHNPIHEEVRLSLINSIKVQIWHGITIKKLGHMTNYKSTMYDLMISTSNFVTDYSFSKLFDYKKIINAGYPRNDILVNGVVNDKSLVLANKEILEFIKISQKKILVYMPTWRPYSKIKNPIDVKLLNQFAKENNFLIIIKSHPFTRNDSFYSSTFDESLYNYSDAYKENLIFYPTTDDIYPILAISDMLITDYSSIYFDYLFVNKPILFFIYDKEIYIQEQGEFMLDFDGYTPGYKIDTFENLKTYILQELICDNFMQERLDLRDKMFEVSSGDSCQRILSEIEKL